MKYKVNFRQLQTTPTRYFPDWDFYLNNYMKISFNVKVATEWNIVRIKISHLSFKSIIPNSSIYINIYLKLQYKYYVKCSIVNLD